MREFEEGFEIDLGTGVNTGCTRETASPLEGSGSLRFDLNAVQYYDVPAGQAIDWVEWFGFHFQLSPVYAGYIVCEVYAALGLLGTFYVGSDKIIHFKVDGIDIAVGRTVLQDDTLYHIQIQYWIGSNLRVKIGDRLPYEMSCFPPLAVAMTSFPTLYQYRIGSMVAVGAGYGLIDDVVVNSGDNVQGHDFSWPGMVTIRTSPANGVGYVDEWTNTEPAKDKWEAIIQETNALPAVVPQSFTLDDGTPQVVNNVGTLPTFLTGLILGPAHNPKIEDQTTGEYLEFIGDVPADWMLIFNTADREGSIWPTAGGAYEDWSYKISSGSTAFWMPSGNNTMLLTCSGTTAMCGWVPIYDSDKQAFTFPAHPAEPGGTFLDCISDNFWCYTNGVDFAKIIPGVRNSGGTNYWAQFVFPLDEHIWPDGTERKIPFRMKQNPLTGGMWTADAAQALQSIFKWSNLYTQRS